LNGAAKSFEEDGGKGQAAEPRALPQWVVDSLLRPATSFVSRAFWHITFQGREHISPPTGGLVIAANHQTYFDPFWISIAFERPIRYLAWNELFKWPLASKPLELLGAWPLVIDRGNPTAYRRSLQWLRKGGAVMIFPEGGRSGADGELARFKTGAARLALEAGVPIQPVTIRGGHRVWPRGQKWPRLGRVEIIIHPARRPAPLPGEDARRCAQRETEELATVIKSELK
jgi:1-acyl-sn-glycerol-3-phosphate acyltransferase